MVETPAPAEARAAATAEAFASLDASQRRTFFACLGGLVLDGMDNAIFGLITPSLIAIWHISRGEAGLATTYSVLSAAVGGWAAGALSDRFGRVRALQWSILLFSLFSLLCALAPNMTQLMLFRVLYGLGFGGQMAVSIALIGEISPPKHRATLLGWMHSMFSVGAGLAAALSAICLSAFPVDTGWRVLFAVGALPALMVFYFRRYVPEPTKPATGDRRASPLEIFRAATVKDTLLGGCISWGTLAGVAGVQTWLPTYLRADRHLSVMSSTANIVLYQLAHFAGYVAGGYIADRLGRRTSFLFSSVLSLASVLAYTLLPLNDFGALALTVPMGFFTATIYGGMGALFAEIFPPQIRGSGVAFCYNFGRALSAFAPALIGFASDGVGLSTSIGIFAGGAYGIVVVAGLLVPETKAKVL